MQKKPWRGNGQRGNWQSRGGFQGNNSSGWQSRGGFQGSNQGNRPNWQKFKPKPSWQQGAYSNKHAWESKTSDQKESAWNQRQNKLQKEFMSGNGSQMKPQEWHVQNNIYAANRPVIHTRLTQNIIKQLVTQQESS